MAATKSQSWAEFLLSQRSAAPLVFVQGMRHHPNTRVYCPMHSHACFEIVYHPVGRGSTRTQSGQSIQFEEGSVVVYPPLESHDQEMASDGEDLCVQIAFPNLKSRLSAPAFCLDSLDDPAVIEDIRLLSRGHVHLSETEQAIFNLRATSALLSLVHLAASKSPPDKRDLAETHVLKAEQFIRNHFATISSLAEVAAHAGLSHDHLRHAFQLRRKKSMAQYLNEIRIERAKTLLIHSTVPLKQLASMCGFNDEYYFSTVFRKFAGCPPGKYRSR